MKIYTYIYTHKISSERSRIIQSSSSLRSLPRELNNPIIQAPLIIPYITFLG